MKCKCGNSILQKSADGGARVRLDGPITIGPDGVASAKCFWCKALVQLPLELKKGALASATLPQASERFVIKKK